MLLVAAETPVCTCGCSTAIRYREVAGVAAQWVGNDITVSVGGIGCVGGVAIFVVARSESDRQVGTVFDGAVMNPWRHSSKSVVCRTTF